MIHMKAFLLASILFVQLAVTATIYTPVGNGTVFFGSGIYPAGYMQVIGGPLSSQSRADLQFGSFDAAQYNSIQLEVSPITTPLNTYSVNLYGYDNASGQLTFNDFTAGTYLGTFAIPSNIHPGQPVYLDVTSFVHSVTGSFFGLELGIATSGEDDFCSTTRNYGTPPELIATVVPEPFPPALAVLILGLKTVIKL
jgi:hypothetical protein